MACGTLMAIRVQDRDNTAVKIQEVLTRHGCMIDMRLGLHDQDGANVCSTSGTLILRMCCTPDEARLVEADLTKIEGVKAKFVDFD
ncbi:hypothetical protein LJC31_01205 [Synergistaceae bacterium OttesenSCG-928-I11]|nr:hypothetical protein [Synergistaceae bacterium OttesenSCG-928-I11]